MKSMAKHQWSSTHDHLHRLAAHNYQQYEDSYRKYNVKEEVLSHFVDFEGDQIPVYIFIGEQRPQPMGYRNNNGLRRSELKCLNCQGPHMVSKCPNKHEYNNQMTQRPRHPPLETPPQPPYKVSFSNHRTLTSGSKEYTMPGVW